MFGALLCGIAYKLTKKLSLTLAAEVFGTAVLGGLCAYPIGVAFMGVNAAEVAFYAYIVPFLISTAAGALISAIVITALGKTGLLNKLSAR
jgi:energy coupling factor transporter S component ThiW